MELKQGCDSRDSEVIALFEATFGASEGAEEGALIARLVRELLHDTARADLFVFTATDGDALVAAAIFTRMPYSRDPRRVVLLSPMAVATARQGEGIGQRLLTMALAALGNAGADVAITYGDPAFYRKVGFEPVSVSLAGAPRPLTHPEGWLAKPLTGGTMAPLSGHPQCVPALDDPAFW
ncbi:GNAT family N-acetyltransferase [Roseovarius salis]|uniref:GNAT family N-acetyltransferase n=1 Tax=Roseovarius salis TaxID=3376063 RepID=UPI0037C51F4B